MLPNSMRYVFITLFLLCSAAVSHAQYTWNLILPQLAYTVVVNPLNPNDMMVGTHTDSYYRTRDGGLTWSHEYVTEVPVTRTAITSVLISSADTSVLMVGGFGFDGIKRSTDAGATWKRVIGAPLLERMWFISEAIVEDPHTPRIIYAGRAPNVHAIYRSTDTGATWDSVGVIPSGLTTRICTIAIRPDSTNILFAGCTGGVIVRSDDSGHTWRAVPVLNGAMRIADGTEFPKIIFSPTQPLVGYAVATIGDANAIANNGGLFKTTNGGASWDRSAYSDTSLWAVEARVASNGNDDVFVGGFRFGANSIPGDSLVARSVDGGVAFERFNGIVWPAIEGDSTANVWVLRYNKGMRRMLMAANTGLYMLDEPTGVQEGIAPGTIPQFRYANGTIELGEGTMSEGDTWSIYDMAGCLVAAGACTASPTIHPGALAAGSYLLTYGTVRKFSTARILVGAY